jgi:hypothetical protein
MSPPYTLVCHACTIVYILFYNLCGNSTTALPQVARIVSAMVDVLTPGAGLKCMRTPCMPIHLELARTVYGRILCDFPAITKVYTPHVHGSGHPHKYLGASLVKCWVHVVIVRTKPSRAGAI